MWELDYKESWVPKIWCFWTVVLEKTLESPLDCKEIKPVTLKETIFGPQYSLEGLMLKLKLQYFDHLMWRTDSQKRSWCWERLKMGGEGDDRGSDGWMASPTQWTWVWVNSGSWRWTGRPGVLQSMGSQSQTWLSDWTELNWQVKSDFIWEFKDVLNLWTRNVSQNSEVSCQLLIFLWPYILQSVDRLK